MPLPCGSNSFFLITIPHCLLAFATCPLRGPVSLLPSALADRLAALEADLLSACSAGDVILAGDFNARVGALDDSPDADHPLPPRGATDITVTQSGQLLVDICRRSGVALGTGRIPGDEVACPTFRARRHTQATRPDHVVFKSATLSRAASLKVNTTRLDSDHFLWSLGCVSLCHCVHPLHVMGLTCTIFHGPLNVVTPLRLLCVLLRLSTLSMLVKPPRLVPMLVVLLAIFACCCVCRCGRCWYAGTCLRQIAP